MRSFVSSCLLVSALVPASAAQVVGSADAPRAPYLEESPEAMKALADGRLDPSTVSSHCAFCAQVVTHDDAQASAVDRGIVWYGRWEDAIAEVERSGRPLMVHFGSPRVMQVCGVW